MSAKKKKNINLIPKEDFERTTLGRIMKWALTTFRFIVIVVEFVVIAGFLYRFYLDVQVSNLEDEINQRSALISSRAQFENDFRKVQSKIEIFKQIADEQNLSLPVIEAVTQSLPADTQIVSISREGNTLDISGAALNENSISSFIANLGIKEKVASVTLSSILIEEDSPLVRFNLIVSLAS